jgi:hypothetical protein
MTSGNLKKIAHAEWRVKDVATTMCGLGLSEISCVFLMNQIKKFGENIIGTVLSVAGLESEYQNQKCIIQGWLTKLAIKSARNWTVRYFLLYENALVYFADSDSQYPRGVMRFDEDFYVCDSCLVPYGFQVSNLSKTYYLQADSLAEKMFWMHTIAKVIGNLSTTPFEESRHSEILEKELEDYAASRPISSRRLPPPDFPRPTSPLPPRPPPRICPPLVEDIEYGEDHDDPAPYQMKTPALLSAPLPPRPRPRLSTPPVDPTNATEHITCSIDLSLDGQEEEGEHHERIRSLSSVSSQSESSIGSDFANAAVFSTHAEGVCLSHEDHPSLHFATVNISPTLGNPDIQIASLLNPRPIATEYILTPSMRISPPAPPQLPQPSSNHGPLLSGAVGPNLGPSPRMSPSADSEVDHSVRFKTALWQEKLKAHQQKQAANPFSDSQSHSCPLKLTKTSAEYGRPPPGTMTAKRGAQATEWVNHEIERLVAVIKEIGTTREDGTVSVLFGRLFAAYQDISNTLVGIMRRAKKKKYIAYSGILSFPLSSLSS